MSNILSSWRFIEPLSSWRKNIGYSIVLWLAFLPVLFDGSLPSLFIYNLLFKYTTKEVLQRREHNKTQKNNKFLLKNSQKNPKTKSLKFLRIVVEKKNKKTFQKMNCRDISYVLNRDEKWPFHIKTISCHRSSFSIHVFLVFHILQESTEKKYQNSYSFDLTTFLWKQKWKNRKKIEWVS